MTLSRKFPMSLNTSLINVWHPYFLFGNPFKFFKYKPQILYLIEIVLYSKFDPARSKIKRQMFSKAIKEKHEETRESNEGGISIKLTVQFVKLIP